MEKFIFSLYAIDVTAYFDRKARKIYENKNR